MFPKQPVKYAPLPQPKQIKSEQTKALNRAKGEIKKKLGITGKVEPGALIKGAMDKKKLSVLGLI